MRFGDLGEGEGPVDRQPEPPRLDELSDLGEGVEGVPVGESVTESHTMFLGAREVGEGHDVRRVTGEADELGQDAVSGDVQGAPQISTTLQRCGGFTG